MRFELFEEKSPRVKNPGVVSLEVWLFGLCGV